MQEMIGFDVIVYQFAKCNILFGVNSCLIL